MDRRTFLASVLVSPVATAATEKPKSKEYSDLEKELLLILADMVGQNCSPIEDVYETGWIGVHKEAMMTLVEHGMMAEVSDGYGRGYWATFTPRTPWGTPQIWAPVPRVGRYFKPINLNKWVRYGGKLAGPSGRLPA